MFAILLFLPIFGAMKAVGFHESLPISHPESLLDVDVPRLEPSGHDLLVAVRAVSVNPVDTKVRFSGDLAGFAPRVLGWDAAGVVEAVGEDVSLVEVGDQVYYAGAITRQGCNSEYHLVDERIVGTKPESLSFSEAAALPLTTITAWEALFDRLGLSRVGFAGDAKHRDAAIPGGEIGSILIIGGAGGVGSIAIQLAKRVAGLKVIATASRDESVAWCRQLGADETVDHHRSFRDEFDRVGIEDVDNVLCLNSLEVHFEKMPDVLKPQGRICTITRAANNKTLNMTTLFPKSIGFLSELMFTRSTFQTADMIAQRDLLCEAAMLVDEGVLRTTMTVDGGRLSAENLRAAHARVEAGSMIGKMVLTGIS